MLDTNILIPLEDLSQVLPSLLAEMRRLSSASGHIFYVHPAQKEEIQRDSNKNRRLRFKSRWEQYPAIPNPPQITEENLQDYGWSQKNENDHIDNLLLLALCQGAVHFLITNDNEIHRKAYQAKYQEQVHRPEQFLHFLKSQNEEILSSFCGVQDRHLYEFSVKQPFFDSLREAYKGFNNWYQKGAREWRKAWCISNQEKIQAMCIYKQEENPKIVDNKRPLDGSALKLCTFKVAEEMRGRKLGERLLNCAFTYSSFKNISYVYLHTSRARHEYLVSLCSEFGFKYEGKYKARDDVYIKTCTPPQFYGKQNPVEYAIDYYPHYLDNSDIHKFLVPIKPIYHNNLFVDISDPNLFADDPEQYGPESNTIKKAYICEAKIRRINPGDLLLFYRTQDRKSIQCIGVVEQIYHGQEIDKILPLVSKRTVYKKYQLEKKCEKEILVILFRLMHYFSPIHASVLRNIGIQGPIRSIRSLTDEQYCKIKERIRSATSNM